MPINTKVKVNVPNLSSFDKSFKNILTTKVGTITPLCCKLLIPGSKGSLKIALSASLPPLASDTFMRADLKVEAFVIPMRLLYGGFESWLTGSKLYAYSSSTELQSNLPRIAVSAAQWSTWQPYLAAGTLSDYLGIRMDITQTVASGATDMWLNVFPYLAYHRAYHDWYRNAKIQTPVFRAPVGLDQTTNAPLSAIPFIATGSIKDFKLNDSFTDGGRLGNLRQRNYGDDYFTIATPSAQVGNPQSVTVTNGVFTIAALRASNSLQQFSERSNLASPRLQDYVKAHYGADLSGGVAQRSVLLGSASYPVYSKGVEAVADSTATNNPFTSVGARYGNAFASGQDFACQFEANEPSYLLVNATLVPQANYATGIDAEMRMFTRAGSQVDLPDPLLENTGNEPIYSSELTGSFGNSQGAVFGYVPRYTRHKTGLNTVHGLLRNGESLASFVAQRSLTYNASVGINDAFLKVPTTALDNVTAVTSDLSNYGVWIDSFIDLKVAEPLTECAMPSLQDPAYEHGHGVTIEMNGSKL